MTKSRLEAFSDGVIAIIITIMVLELKTPADASWESLVQVRSVFLSYVLSFVGVAIYWINHHHLIQAVHKVNASLLWANINLLFWLSLVPFVTSWMGETHFDPIQVMMYALVCNLCGIAYFLILLSLKSSHRHQSATLSIIEAQSKKGAISAGIYFIAFWVAWFYPMVSLVLFILVALMWVIPDRRIEATLKNQS
jgi:uncharacterized membrane protein